MNILITGSNGFVGKNLVAELRNRGYENLMLCDRNTKQYELETYALQADFVFHLAGVNRPEDDSEFKLGNQEFTEKLVELLSKNPITPPVMFASSIQAELSNPYGKSKRRAEDILRTYGKQHNTDVMIYRFPNLFGKWCRPNYNSVIATFCYNISRGIPIQVNNGLTRMKIAYIDDVVGSLINLLNKNKPITTEEFYQIYPTYSITLNTLVKYLESFKESRNNLSIVQLDDELVKKLYSTYLSYLPKNEFSYELTMHCDDRGSFTEFIRTEDSGQVSINISKPGITKGNHWHHTKNEKFLVVSGHGVIRFRKVGSDEIIEYFVSGNKHEVVDVPVGYTHNIENLGDSDMVTVMWVNEPFDPQNADTFFMEV